MAGKELTFKLVMDADVKSFVENTERSEAAVRKMFDELRKESQNAGQSTEQASQGIEQVGDKAQEAANKTNALDQALGKTNDELGQTATTASNAGAELTDVGTGAQASVAGVNALDNSLNAVNAEMHETATIDANLDTVGKDAQSSVSGVNSLEQGLDQLSTELDDVKTTSNEAGQATSKIVDGSTTTMVTTLTEKLNAATQQIKDAGTGAGETARNFSEFGTKAEKALETVKSDLDQAKQKLQQFAATNASPADIATAQAEVDKLEKEVEQADQAMTGFRAATDKANTELRNTSSAADVAQKGIGGVKTAYTALVGAMAAIGIGLGIKELADAADSYTNLSARIHIATQDGGNFAQAMAGVHQVALATNSSLDSTGDLFSRINTIGKDMNLTQAQSLELTETISKAIQIGGGSAQATDAALQQFIQGLQEGVIRGENFNSIMEQSPGLADAIAKSLGVTTGELRKMAENGELGAERVLKGMISQKDAITATYSELPLTIGNALQKIGTSWQILIGEMDQANGASATVAQWLSTLADNMNALKPIIDDIGSGFNWVGNQLSNIDSTTIEALYEAIKTAYEGIKSLITTLADAGMAVVDIFNTALDSLMGFDNSVDKSTAKTNGFTKAIQAINVVLGFLNDGFNAIGIGVNLLVGALYSVSAAFEWMKSKVTWGSWKQEALQNMSAMQEKAEEYYQKASDGALKFQSAGIAAIQEISKTEEQKNAERVADNEKTLTELKAQEEKHKADYKTISDERIKLNQQLVDARKSGDQSAIDAAVAGLAELDKKEKEYQAEGKKITDAKIAAAQAVAEATIKSADAAGQAELKAFNAKIAAQGLQAEFNSAGKVVVTAMNDASDATERQVNATDAARKAAAALGIDVDASLNRVSAKFHEGENNLVAFSNGLDGLGATGEQAADLTYQAWQKWAEQAKSPAEIDAAKAKLLEFKDTGVFSAKQVEMGMRYLDEVNGKLPDNISEVEKAYKLLGITSREEANKMADSQMKAFNIMKQSGTASAEQIRQALINMADKIYASGDAAKIVWYEGQLAASGLSSSVNEAGKQVVSANEQMAASAQKHASTVSNQVTSAYRQMGQVAREEAKHSIEAWNEALSKKIEEEKKTKQSQNKPISYNLYSKNDIADRLRQLGYDDEKAKAYANSIMIKARDADKALMTKNNMLAGGEYANDIFKQNMAKGLTAQGDLIERMLSNFSVGNVATSAKNIENKSTSKTVKYELSIDGNSAELYGDSSQESNLNAFMSQLERLKKGM